MVSVIARLQPKVHRLRVELPAAFLTLNKGALQKKHNTLHKQKCSFLLCFRPILLPDAQDLRGGWGAGAYAGRQESKLELLKGFQQLSLGAFLHL